jgi:hypothetical protein
VACPKCNDPNPEYKAYTHAGGRVRAYCLTCKRKSDRERAARHRKLRSEKFAAWRAKNREYLRQKGEERRRTKRAKVLLATIRTRARNRGLKYDLDSHVDEIQARIDAGVCEVSGFPLSLEPGSPFNAPSIDRKDPKRGYVYDNIRVVCYAVNCCLGDWGEGAFWQIVRKWAEKDGDGITAQTAQAFIEAYMEATA